MFRLGNPEMQRRRTEWIPPPHLDSGHSRVNDYHHPENYLRPDDEDESLPTPRLARSRSIGWSTTVVPSATCGCTPATNCSSMAALAGSDACWTSAAIGVRLMYCHRNSAGAGSRKVAVATLADTSRKPPSQSRAATASGSCMENTAPTKPPRSGEMWSTIDRSRVANSGCIRPGVLIAPRPDGTSTSCLSALAADRV